MCNAKERAGEVSGNSYFKTDKNVIGNKDFNENNTSNFMLSVWFYIENWGDNIATEKNILFVSSKNSAETHENIKDVVGGISSSSSTEENAEKTFKNLNIALDKYENNLIIDIETYSETRTNETTATRYLIKNIPVQKWNCLTISVDTKTLDVYLDGKLRNSFILHGIYKNKLSNNKDKNIYLGDITDSNAGFTGFITRIRYQPNAINPQESYNIYKDGIKSSLANSMYNKYGLKVSFLEYDKEKSSVSI
tara:strand:- start:5190 stop:5939 length:750 start_codon:yes stop_codon:yes gene_type:complete